MKPGLLSIRVKLSKTRVQVEKQVSLFIRLRAFESNPGFLKFNPGSLGWQVCKFNPVSKVQPGFIRLATRGATKGATKFIRLNF